LNPTLTRKLIPADWQRLHDIAYTIGTLGAILQDGALE
jgi:hypothetical protein